MSMVILNLLTKERRHDLSRRVSFVVLKNSLAVVVILVTVVAVTLLASKLALTNAFNELVAQSALVTREYSGINTDIRNLNLEVQYLYAIQAKSVPVSPVVAHLFTIVPDGVTFSSLGIDTKNNLISIRGRAATRDILVSFRSTLEASPWFDDVSSPLSNIVVKSNIPFEFAATLVPTQQLSSLLPEESDTPSSEPSL